MGLEMLSTRRQENTTGQLNKLFYMASCLCTIYLTGELAWTETFPNL